MLCAFGASHPGLRRSNNEDSFLCVSERGLFAVADGLGGLMYGEVASGLLVELLDSAQEQELDDLNALALRLSEAIADKGAELCASTIGTTMTLAIVREGKLRIAQVGDSVAFLLTSEDGFRQLTTEQTVADERRRAGRIDIEPYMNHVLTQCMGQKEAVVPELLELDFPAGARLLLCSDGITKTVQDEHIHEALAECETPQRLVKELIDMANRAGGPDNSTVVAVFA